MHQHPAADLPPRSPLRDLSRPGGAQKEPSAPTGWRVLRVASVWKRFGPADGSAPWVLRDVTLDFEAGSFTCIVGPSGSGKTTLLNLLAGFDAPTRGVIALDDVAIRGAARDRAVIFQDVSNALFPWLTAVENVEFGLRMQALPRPVCRERALSHLALVGLDRDCEKFPYQLSGGMKQRVQIARALANDPSILLMDEPFVALDAITRRDLQEELVRVWAKTRKTVVFITHDLIEALLLGTRVVVIGADGAIQGDFAVPLPTPRSPSDLEFMRLYDALQGILETVVRRAKRGAKVNDTDRSSVETSPKRRRP
ncbi:MAG: ABC transporter ATP-binding protein [Candidatus Rokubacteria bacterium]|nr:ABC transporter ATP-binding protein [Candidatus Rokubacteria bacterium]